MIGGAVTFGVMYNTGVYGVDPGAMAAVARHAEDCGFESFYVPEHIALYPGAAVGAMAFPPATPIADPLECLSFVAAATQRILLGTGVLLLPYHQEERASQFDLVRATAADAGRDADALEYTRWGSIDMTAADVEALAARGPTRLVFGPASTDLDQQREQLSSFAERLKLR
jgi:hypothetical protein